MIKFPDGMKGWVPAVGPPPPGCCKIPLSNRRDYAAAPHFLVLNFDFFIACTLHLRFSHAQSAHLPYVWLPWSPAKRFR